MRRTSILAFAMMVLGAMPAAPQGLNLYWDACGPTDGHEQTLFACDANTPPASMFVSVYPWASMTQFAAATFYLRFYIADGTAPPWWQTVAGQCRQDAILPSFHPEDLPDTEECPSLWQGADPVFVHAVQAIPTEPWAFRFVAAAAVPLGSELALAADGRQRAVARVTVLRSKTVGADACEGCRVGACIWLVEASPQSPTEPKQTITNIAHNAVVGHNASSQLDTGGFYCTTPTANRTWGSIKALYR